MPAYVIFIREKTRDADQLVRYKEKAQAVFANHPVTFALTTAVIKCSKVQTRKAF
ncbi:hypothetical protein LJR034_005902 [Caballeronia sp. LjRoot34]|uniref:hypothetical protein n=1 Tax=Caballeronia sp. LjRoot34 TaxID=3342325 RepID=UPI003ECC2D25